MRHVPAAMQESVCSQLLRQYSVMIVLQVCIQFVHRTPVLLCHSHITYGGVLKPSSLFEIFYRIPHCLFHRPEWNTQQLPLFVRNICDHVLSRRRIVGRVACRELWIQPVREIY